MQFGMTIAFTDPADYVPLAVAAEENGFSAITLPDHLIYPQQLSRACPYTADGVPRFTPDDPFADPWLSAVAMATATRKLWFYTSVFVLPARNPVHVAKILASAACLTGSSPTTVTSTIGTSRLRSGRRNALASSSPSMPGMR